MKTQTISKKIPIGKISLNGLTTKMETTEEVSKLEDRSLEIT